eukprot:290144_1
MADVDPDTKQLQTFLDTTLPNTIAKCDEHTKQLIIDGHKELESYLLSKYENISKDKFSKDMQTACLKLQQRIYEKFTTKYQQFIKENIVSYKDNPFITNNLIIPSKDKYQSVNENLLKQKTELYKEYMQKQQILKQINNETIELQNEYNNNLESINDSYQSMKSQIYQQHQQLISQLQTKFDYDDQEDSIDIQSSIKADASSRRNNEKSEKWHPGEITTILPLEI